MFAPLHIFFLILAIFVVTNAHQPPIDPWQDERTVDKIYLQHHGLPLQLHQLDLISSTTPTHHDIIIYSDLNILTRRTTHGDIIWKQSSPMSEFPLFSHYSPIPITPSNPDIQQTRTHLVYTFSLSSKSHDVIDASKSDSSSLHIISRQYSTDGLLLSQLSTRLPTAFSKYTTAIIADAVTVRIGEVAGNSCTLLLSLTTISLPSLSISLDFSMETSNLIATASQQPVASTPTPASPTCSVTSPSIITITQFNDHPVFSSFSIDLSYFEDDHAPSWSESEGESRWYPSIFHHPFTLPYLYAPAECWFTTSTYTNTVTLYITNSDRFFATFSLPLDSLQTHLNSSPISPSPHSSHRSAQTTTHHANHLQLPDFTLLHLSNEHLPFSLHSTPLPIPRSYAPFMDFIGSTKSYPDSLLVPQPSPFRSKLTNPPSSEPSNHHIPQNSFPVSTQMNGSSSPLDKHLFITISQRNVKTRSPNSISNSNNQSTNYDFTMTTYYAPTMKLLTTTHFSIPKAKSPVSSFQLKLTTISDQHICLVSMTHLELPPDQPNHNILHQTSTRLHCLPFASILSHNPIPLLKLISPSFNSQMKQYYKYVETEVAEFHKENYRKARDLHLQSGFPQETLPEYIPVAIHGANLPHNIIPYSTFVNAALNFHYNSTFFTHNPFSSDNAYQAAVTMNWQHFLPQSNPPSNNIFTTLQFPNSLPSPHSPQSILTTPTSLIDLASQTHIYTGIQSPLRLQDNNNNNNNNLSTDSLSNLITSLTSLTRLPHPISIANDEEYDTEVFRYLLSQCTTLPTSHQHFNPHSVIVHKDALEAIFATGHLSGLLYLHSTQQAPPQSTSVASPQPASPIYLHPLVVTSLPTHLFNLFKHIVHKLYLPTLIPHLHFATPPSQAITTPVATPAMAPFLFTVLFQHEPPLIFSLTPLPSLISSPSPNPTSLSHILFQPHHQFVQNNAGANPTTPEPSTKPSSIPLQRISTLFSHSLSSQQLYSPTTLSEYLYRLFMENCDTLENIAAVGESHLLSLNSPERSPLSSSACQNLAANLQDPTISNQPAQVFKFVQEHISIVKGVPFISPVSSVQLQANPISTSTATSTSPILSLHSLLPLQNTHSTLPPVVLFSAPLELFFPDVFPSSTTASPTLSDFSLFYTKNRITVLYSPYKSYLQSLKLSTAAQQQPTQPSHPTYILTVDLYRLAGTPLIIPITSAFYSNIPFSDCTVTTTQLSISSSAVLCYSHIERRIVQFPAWYLSPSLSSSSSTAPVAIDEDEDENTAAERIVEYKPLSTLQNIPDPLHSEFYISMDYLLDSSQSLHNKRNRFEQCYNFTHTQPLYAVPTHYESSSVVYHLGIDFYATVITRDGGFDRLGSTGRLFGYTTVILTLIALFIGLAYCKHQARMTRFRNEWR